MENTCVQCSRVPTNASNRLVLDTCGHKKCRICLLNDEQNCKQCTNGCEESDEKATKIARVDDNHATVITCNGGRKGLKDGNICDKPAVNCNTVKKEIKIEAASTVSRKKRTKAANKRAYAPIIIPSYITVQEDPISYHCSICDKNFATKAHIKYHSYCEAAVKPHRCEVCLREFVLKAQLDVHMLNHTGTKPHKCNVCPKSFTEPARLSRHLKCHSLTKPHVCSECGKAFRSKESLKLHTIIHRGDRPYDCKMCSARFNNLSNLKKHHVSHSSEKVHMCDLCGKQFKLKWTLQVHRKSHMQRQFECSTCLKLFMTNKDLQRHSLIHVDSKGFACSICGTSFRRKDNLSRHMKNTHPDTKGEIIKNVIKRVKQEPTTPAIDNPNAINVITASPAFTKKTDKTTTNLKLQPRMGTVINAPIKLAFKTPAFKNNYNIHRVLDYKSTQACATYDMAESVNICQKILSPLSPLPQSRQNETASNEICKDILSTPSKPFHYETSFQNQKHAMIKNIKFKVPSQYTMLNSSKPNDMVANNPVPGPSNAKVYTELKPVVDNSGISVIVKANQHWRRRTSQNLNLK